MKLMSPMMSESGPESTFEPLLGWSVGFAPKIRSYSLADLGAVTL